MFGARSGYAESPGLPAFAVEKLLSVLAKSVRPALLRRAVSLYPSWLMILPLFFALHNEPGYWRRDTNRLPQPEPLYRSPLPHRGLHGKTSRLHPGWSGSQQVRSQRGSRFARTHSFYHHTDV